MKDKLCAIANIINWPFRLDEQHSAAEAIIDNKHKEYTIKAKIYKWSYYCTRIIVGLSAGIIPFVINRYQTFTIGLSLTIVIVTVLDTIFNPRSNWALFETATNCLTVKRLQKSGDYEEHKQIFDLLSQTELKSLEQLLSLHEIKTVAQNASSEHVENPKPKDTPES